MMLGPSGVSGWPQQNSMVNPTPSAPSTRGKPSAAQPESGPERARWPSTPPRTNMLNVKTISNMGSVIKRAPAVPSSLGGGFLVLVPFRIVLIVETVIIRDVLGPTSPG